MSGSPLAALHARSVPSRAVPAAAVGWLASVQSLSLDIVLGVGCAAAFAVATTRASMPLSWWILLPLATWVVYSVDHLLDARRTGARSQQPRHRFYHRRFVMLRGLTLVLLPAGALAGVVLLPAELRLPALLAGLAAAIHLVLAQGPSGLVTKEFSTASIYIGGIWFGPMLLAPRLDGSMFAFAALHLTAALLNLIAFAVFEERPDTLDGHASIVRSWGRPAACRLLAVLTALGTVGVLLTAALGATRPPAASIVLLILIVTPGLMVWQREAFATRQRYRVVGDLAFLLMVLPFWLGR